MSSYDLAVNTFNNAGEYQENYQSRVNQPWAARIDYGFGKQEVLYWPNNVDNYEIQAVHNLALAHMKRTGVMPRVEFYKYNPIYEKLCTVADIGTKVAAWSMVGASLAAGFLDRYRLTLAARINGITSAIATLNDVTKPCRDRLPAAIDNLEKTSQVFAEIKDMVQQAIQGAAERLPIATAALNDAEKGKVGLEVCTNLVGDFTKLVEPMHIANRAMKTTSLANKALAFAANLDMTVAREAWNTYSIGEQSLGFLVTTATVAAVGLSVQAATRCISTNVLNLESKHAKIAANVAGVAAGLYVAVANPSLMQTATIGVCAGIAYGAARVVGIGINGFRAITGL